MKGAPRADGSQPKPSTVKADAEKASRQEWADRIGSWTEPKPVSD